MSSAADPSTKNVCSACDTSNSSSAQFCSGCGKSLWEKCASCNSPTLIGSKFCSSCGFDLQGAFNERLEDFRSKVSRAQESAQKGDLDLAIRVLDRLLAVEDHRMRDELAEVAELKNTLEDQRQEWLSKIESLPQTAKELLDSHKYKAAAELFIDVPEGLLDADTLKTKQLANEKSTTANEAIESLKKSLDAKEWTTAILELSKLIPLFPNKAKYRSLHEQVCQRILKTSQQLAAKGRQAEALVELESIPVEDQTDEVRSFFRTLEELVFLRRIVAASPFASPFVNAAIDRVSQLTPNDPRTAQIRKKFDSVASKTVSKDFQSLPSWMKTQGGRFETSLIPACLPRSLKGSRPQAISKAGSRFWTAYGLALRGLSEGPETANLIKEEKSGFLGMIGRKKKPASEVAWGIDIGDFSIKAVRLKRNEAGSTELDEAVMFPIDPEKKTEVDSAPKSKRVFKVLEQVLSDKAFRDIPVVSNVPSSDLLARYLQLPVDKPAKHATFVEQEAKANIPIDSDLLNLAYYTFQPSSESDVSQNAMLLALRKSEIEARASMFRQLEINLTGLTPEPIANVLAMQEFAFLDQLGDTPHKSILIVDVGFLRTTVQVVSRCGSWYRTIDWGTSNLNQQLATDLKLTNFDADSLRKNPMRGRSAVEVAKSMQAACTVPLRELERSVRAAQEFLGRTEIVCPILIGGGANQPLLGSLLNGESII